MTQALLEYSAADIVVFVGYADDAIDEGRVILSTEAELQRRLDRYRQLTGTTLARLRFFDWRNDARNEPGGQPKVIEPALDRANIAVFVFRHRVGRVTWEELTYFRERRARPVAMIALFPAGPGPDADLSDLSFLEPWADLQRKKGSLTTDWTEREGNSVTPVPEYTTHERLREIALDRLDRAIRHLVRTKQTDFHADRPPSISQESAVLAFVDTITELRDFEHDLLYDFRRRLRPDVRQDYPSDLADTEFLNRWGFLRKGCLTIGGVLLFGPLPTRAVPSAKTQCVFYRGIDRSAPRDRKTLSGSLVYQIEGARDFVAANSEKIEIPSSSTATPDKLYRYPMESLRELITNAICHRRYDTNHDTVHVRMFLDRIEICSPGEWGTPKIQEGETVSLDTLEGQSVKRNPAILDAVASIDLAEVEGLGIPIAINECRNIGAPTPHVRIEDGNVVVTVFPREQWPPGEPSTTLTPVTAKKVEAVFISYAHRYSNWVETLHRNLDLCATLAGVRLKIFLDQVDLGAGVSWVSQLQVGLDQADMLILVASPEALASPRVVDEWQNFIALHPDWHRGRLLIAIVVDTPLPPIFQGIQCVDFRLHDEPQYRKGLRELFSAMLEKDVRETASGLPEGVEVPEPPDPGLPPKLRRQLVDWIASLLQRRAWRPAIASALGMESYALEGFPSVEAAASAALVWATGDDHPAAAALRIVKALGDAFEVEPELVDGLAPLREELEALEPHRDADRGLLGLWLRSVERDHAALVPYFEQGAGPALLGRVYVQLELRADRRPGALPETEPFPLARAHALDELLDLDPADHPWVTRRWVVLGDPGAGKTTLLRYLAWSLARAPQPRWVPLFESWPRLMRVREWLLDRIARQLGRAGHAARGLPAVLDREAREGRLLFLLDGLDEIPREERGEAESLLRDFSARWPQSPIVVTSRPIGYRRPAHDFLELDLLPLDRDRQREFLARWFGRRAGEPASREGDHALRLLDAEPGLRELASNPLYLTLMGFLVERGSSPDRHRCGLYDQVFELLLDGGHRPAGEPMDCRDATRRVLRHLALEMTRDNRDAEPREALEARLYHPEADPLREPLERVPRWRRSLRPFLDDLAERTGILGPHDGPQADWRFWHRTFREALAAEALEDKFRAEGQAAILEHARGIAGDESRWAEPYALLAGRVEDPDALVRALVGENRALGLRALATAQGLEDGTLSEILELSDEWEERIRVYERIPELLDDPQRALALVDQLRQRTRNGNDLFFLERAVGAVAERWPDAGRTAQQLQSRFYDHIPAPAEDLFRWIETPLDGRVPLWREIPAGTFQMGSLPEEKGSSDDEKPRHQVTVASAFALGAVPVTNAQYATFDPGYEPHRWEGVPEDELGHHPVVQVTWYEAMAFCRWLSAALPWTRGARLPTEEEWEYACRAGSGTRYWSGDKEADLKRVGWYGEGPSGRTHRVGEKPANPWGLYDVHGNVLEWALSAWTDDYSARETGITVDPPAIDPADLAAASGERRVLRGGGFWLGAWWARSAYRSSRVPGAEIRVQGFRALLPRRPEALDH